MKIILIRHAKVEVDIYSWCYGSELKEWLEIYNGAEISKELVNKAEIEALFNESDMIIASQLKRAIDSVKLYEREPTLSDAIFNEASLPFSDTSWIKLPLVVWSLIFRIMWLFGYSRNGVSLKEERVRAKKATDKLLVSAKDGKTLLLLGHGLMNRLIAKELRQRGWSVTQKMGSDNWDYGVFTME